MLEFKKVDREIFDDVINLEVEESQKGFMESNLISLAECSFEKKYVNKAIIYDGKVVGFLLYYQVVNEDNYVYLHRIMIDKSCQGKGIGKQAVKEAMKMFKEEFPDITCIELMHYPDNITGAKLYENLGFKETGEKRESEPCRSEEGTDNPNRYFEIVRRYYYQK